MGRLMWNFKMVFLERWKSVGDRADVSKGKSGLLSVSANKKEGEGEEREIS
jgi:hypothetical protein